MELLWIIIVGVILIFMVLVLCTDTSGSRSSEKTEPQSENENVKPKIGAEVTLAFYDEMKDYCSRHSLTISDLIRNAVRLYMDMYE